MTRKKRLGRGLEALLNTTVEPIDNVSAASTAVAERPDSDQVILPGRKTRADLAKAPAKANATSTHQAQHGSVPSLEKSEPGEGEIVHLNVYDIQDNPFQPRRVFSETEIASLAESLKEHDILQPILVRVVDGSYQLISGERRLRAAIKANWKTIPARLRTADDRLVSELAIVENLQRQDLNPIEKALSFRRYLDEHECTQEGLAGRLKIDRSTIANLMRLLELPAPIQDSLQGGEISAGHARALLPLGDEKIQNDFCKMIIRDGMSVRATERAVSDKIAAEDTFGISPATRRRRAKDRQLESLQQELKSALGTKVQIRNGAGQRGQIVLHFSDSQEFERLRAILSGREASKKAA